MKIAREGYPWILAAVILSLIAFSLGWIGMGGVLAFFAVVFAGFFRDPERTPPAGEGLVLAPADGKVVAIVKDAEGGATRVSIFLSLLDVHVNRAPIQGLVEKVQYQPGKFHAAYREDASQDNEQNAVRLVDSTGKSLHIVQIAGLLARRIICYVKEGETLERGQRFGLIMFGSRVDLFMPPGSTVEVAKGQRVRAGETIIGRL
ncbi:MAG: phosphatidylserine decarboxylase family protein [Deltaproteobacteria bacterium]|nr:phosphatidylserine decarboxylase family protein [Deltaproteobacteria bacterium]